MIRAVFAGDEDFRILSGFEAAEHGAIEFSDVPSAASFLSRFLVEPHSRSILREVIAEDPGAPETSSLDDHEVMEALAWRLFERSLRIERLPRLVLGAHGELPTGASRPPAAAAKETTWIEFKIVDDRDNRPVSKLELTVTRPDGSEATRTTDAGGLITLDPTPAGSYGLRCDGDHLTFKKTLELVGMGDGIVDEAQEAPKAIPGPLRIANVEHHRVRAGETLDGLAKAAGTTWQALARFNFGTDEPGKVNVALRVHVGCTHKTPDRKNYVFSDADEPGLLFIPRRWERRGLSTGCTHVFRVRPLLRPPRRFLFSY